MRRGCLAAQGLAQSPVAMRCRVTLEDQAKETVMPCKSALLAGLALLALLPDAALAQAKKYVSLNAATLDDVNVALDGAVVESYQAGRLVAAEIIMQSGRP